MNKNSRKKMKILRFKGCFLFIKICWNSFCFVIWLSFRVFILWRILLLFHHWSALHLLSSNLHLHSPDICFVDVFGTYIPVIMLNTLRFESSVEFGAHTFLDKSFRVLQLSSYLSNLTTTGYSEILDCNH